MTTSAQGALTINAFINWASIGRTKVYEEIKAGRLATVKVGRRRLVPLWEAQRWLASHLVATTPNPFAAACMHPLPVQPDVGACEGAVPGRRHSLRRRAEIEEPGVSRRGIRPVQDL